MEAFEEITQRITARRHTLGLSLIPNVVRGDMDTVADLQALNKQLQEELADYKEGVEGLKLSLQDLRPFADAYKRVCQSLGIEKDILGYVKQLQALNKQLLEVFRNMKQTAGKRVVNDPRFLLQLIEEIADEAIEAADKILGGK